MEAFFQFTAWPMQPPVPYSLFHIAVALLGTLGALAAALILAKSDRFLPENVLVFCGLILALSEAYKQGFLYYIVNGRQYNWWYFPFQLCSIPMYLCLSAPFLVRKPAALQAAAVFLQDFGLLGGIMALAVPDGFLYPYWALTLHGFFWHFLLIFIGVYCGRKGLTDCSDRGFLKALPIYLVCCLAAAAINTAVQYTVYPGSYADMFYINSFFPSEQPLFSQISLALGNIWGHLLYLCASCAGAYLMHRLSRIFLAG